MYTQLKKHFYILYFILVAPLYVIINKICFNIFYLPVNGHINTFWYGFYCSLKKQDYAMKSNLIIITVGFITLRLLLFACGMIRGKHQAAIQQALIILWLLDLLGIVLYTAFYFELSGLFKLYFSFSSIFLLSGHIFGLPFYLPLALLIGEYILLSLAKNKRSLREIFTFLIIGSASIVFWYSVRLLVLKLC